MKKVVVTIAIMVAVAVTSMAAELKLVKGFGYNVDVFSYTAKVPNSLQSTEPHRNDSFLHGTTTTDIGSEDAFGVALKLGGDLGVCLDSKYVDAILKFGLEAGIYGACNDEYREGLYDVRQQVSDNRTSGSYGYTQVHSDWWTYMPYVGLDFVFNDFFMVGVDYGVPYVDWTVHSGYDRWGRWERVQEWSDMIAGALYRLKIGIKADEGFNVSLAYFTSEFESEAAGEPVKFENEGLAVIGRFMF